MSLLAATLVSILIVTSIIIASFPYYVAPAEATFSKIKNLSDNIDESSNPQLAVSGNNVYVVWIDSTKDTPLTLYYDRNVFFAASSDNGATFGQVVNLSGNASLTSNPRIAASGENVYVAWTNDYLEDVPLDVGSPDGLFFTASNNKGVTFGPVLHLTDAASDLFQMVASGDNVYLVWVDNDKLFFTTSNDGGVSFGHVIALDENTKNVQSLGLAALDDAVYLMWVDGGSLFFATSNDNGRTLGPATILNRNDVAASDPRLVVSDGNVYIVRENSGDVFFIASTDGGATFGSIANLTSNEGKILDPQIAASGDNVYITWTGYSPNNTPPTVYSPRDLFFTASNDSGATFRSAIMLSNNEQDSVGPEMTQLAASGDELYVVWSNGLGRSNDLFLVTGKDNGDTLEPAINLTGTTGENSKNPRLAISGDNLYIVWADKVEGGFSFAKGKTGPRLNQEILFTASPDGAAGGSPPPPYEKEIVPIPDLNLPGGNGGGGCLIATAAFGSELTPQVQFLRNFRDNHILSTNAGSSFMNVFNAWYYSFSPYVADYEGQQPWLQQTVKVAIYPLLGILTISEKAYSAIPGDYGALLAGLATSSMIGVVYFSPLALSVKRIRNSRTIPRLALYATVGVSVALLASILTGNQTALMLTTSTFVLGIVVMTSIISAKAIVKAIKSFQRSD